MSYLKQKPGSIEEVINKLSSKVLEGDYQDKFKKELEKAGKGIGAMTPKEKSAFFNKIDKMHKAKDEEAPTTADIERLKKMGMKKEEVELSEKASMAKMYTKKASNGDVEVFYRGRTKYGNDKQIGYYHKQGSKFVAYHDNSDDKDDFTQSDTYNDERSAQMTILQTAAKERVITEEVHIDETHMGQTAKANQSQKDAKGEKEVIKPLSMKETLQKMWQEAAEKKEEALTNAEKKKEEEQNKNKKTTDTGEKPSEIETKPEIKYAN